MNNKTNRMAGVFSEQITIDESLMRVAKTRSHILRNIAASGARMAIVVVDNDRHLKLKFRTWTKLAPEQITPDLKYNNHSKFVFVVRGYDELPSLAIFVSRIAIAIDSKNRQLTLIRSINTATGQRFRSDALERVMNAHAFRREHQLVNQVGFGVQAFAQSLIANHQKES